MNRLHDVHAVALAMLVLAVSPWGRSDTVLKVETEVETIRERAQALTSRYLKHGAFKGEQYVAERLVDGEIFYRTKDYHRAAIIFMDLIANYSEHTVYAEALFLYADSLFLAEDYLGAREWFRRVVAEREKPGMGRFHTRAIERLIEIAVHLRDFNGVDRYYQQLGQELSPHAQYVKGKYLYFRGDLEAAKQVFPKVDGEPLLKLKARYMLGVVWTRQGNYQRAIEVFEEAGEFVPSGKDQQEIVDLMNLGAGRLYYELDLLDAATACYRRIAPNSMYFDAALYEAAAVLMQSGQETLAEQTLEVLTVTIPDSKLIPRAKMLRGNLLLRTGNHAKAEKVFYEIVAEFSPVMEQLDAVMAAQHDTRQFFFDLVERSRSTLAAEGVLPPLVVKWVGEEPDVERALTLAGELSSARTQVAEAEKLILLIEAVIDGPSPVNANPLLRQAKRRSQQLQNRLTQQRNQLMKHGAAKLGKSDPELQRMELERRKLAQQIALLPTTNEDFERRERESKGRFESMRRELARQLIHIAQIGAKIVAINKYISDADAMGEVSQQDRAAVLGELRRHQQAAEGMQQELELVRDDIDQALYQVGIGDLADAGDREIAVQVAALAKEERLLLGARKGALAQRLGNAYASIDTVETMLAEFSAEVERAAVVQAKHLRAKVRAEKERVVAYRREIDLLSERAEEVVGGVAFTNFLNVRRRFYELVLRADVGIVDVVWLLKEEHTKRITKLSKARVAEINDLDRRFREVKSGP